MRPEVLNAAVSDKLWTAINQDGLAAFAKRYPSTVTLATVPVTAPLHGRRPGAAHLGAGGLRARAGPAGERLGGPGHAGARHPRPAGVPLAQPSLALLPKKR